VRRASVLLGAVSLLLASRAAQAEEGAASAKPSFEATFEKSSLIDRPHTIAELEVGVISLPTAPISVANQGGATPLGPLGKGDATLQTGLHLLYRASRDFAIGAGAMFAPNPTSDSNYEPVSGGITRTHTRSYLMLGGEARYFPLRYRWFEAWVGLTVGAVIIADRFETQGQNVPPILGARQYSVSTEGFSFGVQAGADYMLTDNWVIGLALRADRWILPNAGNDPLHDPACSPIGDCPTLTGTVEAFEAGVTIGYRIPL
jgi:opacity protein-like surface antigen